MRCTTLLALLTGVILYLVMGALVFSTLESPDERLAYTDLLATKRTFLDNKSCVTELDFHRLVKGVVSAVEAGLDVNGLPENFTSHWDLSSAAFFCGTIITTIGFGNLSPRTWYGQLFCVCYALVGIPLFGILLAGVGDHMGTVLRRAVAKIETLFLKRKVRPTTVRLISAVLSILIGCLIFLAVPTFVFQRVENWSFLEALYFVVITLTTVGFGDYVPGGGRNGMFFKPLVLVWIVFGLAYFASVLTMIGNWLRVLSKKTRAEMEELRAHATDWTQNIQNMSMDFRIPNPLEFNDPFLLQRRRWKRSGRRRIRRGAQVTLGQWAHGGSINGHLPNHWASLSGSASQMEIRSSLERTKIRPQVRAGGAGTLPRMGAGLKIDPSAGLKVEGRLFPHLLARSFSLPVPRPTAKLDPVGSAFHGGSFTESESSFDSDASSASSASLSFCALHGFQPCQTLRSMEEGALCTAQNSGLVPSEDYKPAPTHGCKHKPAADVLHRPSLTPFFDPSHRPILLPSPPLNSASSASCQLLDFFGENLAYIDESSDTLQRSEPAGGERGQEAEACGNPRGGA
ncbi:hypothetical protein fugu_013754 [Takifugu bimaculatus]|uniref:Potassium channel domain-containing protein n=1 Tax=Takifugu bimaculatus TaxID=433685 RepID=A0A4Z2C514_9TELE|nr:hypothetical protein fugu_013754 [Takifugu bimaculatus]